MTRYQLNPDAMEKARSMIRANQYVLESEWEDAQPDTDSENAEIDRNGWQTFSLWHLGVDPDASQGTKERFGFPYGDFQRVHRSGLIHAKQRASQYGHDDVEKGADELLSMLDENATD